MRRGTLKDRRSRFTRKEIRSAYIRLMDTMPKEKITVTLLCKEADINRGTFYLHYETIDDVWKDIENELFEEAENVGASVPPRRFILSHTRRSILCH